jgi:hypothetical protein
VDRPRAVLGKVVGPAPSEYDQTQRESIDLWYVDHTHYVVGNIQALFTRSRISLRVSHVLPRQCPVHAMACARENVLGIVRPLLASLLLLTDPGYEGAGHGMPVPVKKPAGGGELDMIGRACNTLLRRRAAWASAASRC